MHAKVGWLHTTTVHRKLDPTPGVMLHVISTKDTVTAHSDRTRVLEACDRDSFMTAGGPWLLTGGNPVPITWA